MLLRLIFFFSGCIIYTSCLHIESTEPSGIDEEADSTARIDYSIQEYSAISLLGEKLYAPALTSRDRAKREGQLSKSLENFNSNPDNLQSIVWFGNRLSNLFLYKEAIKVYTDGLKKFPESYELFRHRGECFLTMRDFDNAIMDLEKGAFYLRNEPIIMEEVSTRNSRNIPRNSVQFNVWYHLGITYYLKGNYDKAASSFKKCLIISNNDDMLVLATDWMYMTYRRLGNMEAAKELLEPINHRMNVIENKDYQAVLLMYKGVLGTSDVFDLNSTDLSQKQLIQGYGVGNWYSYSGNNDQALLVFNKMMTSDYWPSLGYLAAEVELVNRQAQGNTVKN